MIDDLCEVVITGIMVPISVILIRLTLVAGTGSYGLGVDTSVGESTPDLRQVSIKGGITKQLGTDGQIIETAEAQDFLVEVGIGGVLYVLTLPQE